MKDPHYYANVAITLAFLAIGFDDAHSADRVEAGTLGDEHFSNHGGHIGIVSNLYSYAEFIEQCLLPYEDDGYPGVVHYEVTEPLGAWLFANPDAFQEHLSDAFATHADNVISQWFNPAAPAAQPAAPAAQPETSTMKISTLIAQLRNIQDSQGDLDVLTRGSQPQTMVDADDVRTVKTSKRTAVFIGKPKADKDD